MKRSITARNVAGGFLGGVLGILGFGYVHAFILPFGCILGVLVGWWYQEIFQSAIEGWRKGTARACEVWNKTVLLLTTPTRKLKGIDINLDPFMKVIHFLIFLVAWVFRIPLTFCRWLGKHPMNQVYVIRSLALGTVLALSALWMIPLGKKLNQLASMPVSSASGMEQLSVPFLAVLMMFAVITMISYPIGRSESLKDFYSSWSTYSQYGTIVLFFREVGEIILFQLTTVIFFSGAGVWFIVIGGAFVAAVIAPLSFAIGMVKGIYRVAMKPGHWLCLITTLTITLLTAWQAHSYFADARMLWTAALMTGVLSAIATEGLRRLIALFYASNEFIKRVAITELGVQLLPSGRVFWRFSQAVGDRFFQSTIGILQ